jgi:hypothetical protein
MISILLVDRTASIRRLVRFGIQEFRPTWETCKDADMVRDILDQLLLDTLAVQGATELEETFDHDTPNGLRMSKTGEKCTAWESKRSDTSSVTSQHVSGKTVNKTRIWIVFCHRGTRRAPNWATLFGPLGLVRPLLDLRSYTRVTCMPPPMATCSALQRAQLHRKSVRTSL